MRVTFTCHSVRSADDGRRIVHMSSRRGTGDDAEESSVSEFLLKAPFEAFDGDEPRQWHDYRVTIERVGGAEE